MFLSLMFLLTQMSAIQLHRSMPCITFISSIFGFVVEAVSHLVLVQQALCTDPQCNCDIVIAISTVATQ